MFISIFVIMSCELGSTRPVAKTSAQPVSEESKEALPQAAGQTKDGQAQVAAAQVGGHPRLFFDAGGIQTLRSQASTTHQEIWKPIEQHVKSKLGTTPEVSFFSGGDLNTYRGFGNEIIAFALACVVTEEPNYCDLTKRYMLTFATWDQWGEDNRVGLGHAHMLAGNAIAYDWMYARLSPEEQQVVRQSLAGWAQKMYEASATPDYVREWDNWWRQAYVQNIFLTVHGALGLAGLALLGEDERAQTWIDQAASRISNTQYLLNGIKDGSWHEGLGYQGYALTRALPFMVNLRKIQGTDIFPHEYLRSYVDWRIYNYLPNTTDFILSYGDFDWRFLGSRTQNVLRFIAHEYSDSHAEWLAQQLTAAGGRRVEDRASAWHVFEFLYYDPTIPAQPPTDLEPNRVFPDLEGVIWRTGWNEDDLVFGLKTGAYGGRFIFETFTQQIHPWGGACSDTGCKLNFGHNHEDANTFYLYRAGAWLAPESVKVGNYASSFHNTLLVDGEGQDRLDSDQNRDPAAFVGTDALLQATTSTPNFNYLAAVATMSYASKGLQNFTRHIVFIRPDYFVMLDNVAADRAHEYTWVSHFGQDVAVESNWVRGEAANGQILGVGIAAPQPFNSTTGRDDLPYVHIKPAQSVDNVRFINVLYPTRQDVWNTRPNITLQEDNGRAAVVRVQLNDGSGRIDDILFNYSQPGSEITVGSYNFDGQVAVVSRNSGGGLAKLFMFGGTYLRDLATNEPLITDANRSNPFEAIYAD